MWVSLLIAAGFVLVAFLVAALPAAWMRRRHGAEHVGETRDLARDIANRLGVLHGLILGLVFGHVVAQASDLRAVLRTEAAAVEHVYYLARDYRAPAVETAAARYIDAVVDQDWPAQEATGEVSGAGWVAARALQAAVLSLSPGTGRESALVEAMQSDLWTIERQRQVRGYQSASRVPFEFWFAAISGLALIGGLTFIYSTSRTHLAIVGAYAIYSGLVLYMIFDLSRPFAGLLTVGPEAFEQARGAIRSGL
ncbi:putative integral membrane protein [Lysobacter dokdonensis DS-58]|uniref:Putative integral membrane protein n=1 Tax=Lysobacter dokdonensis DS-58 TaxID=1300345 RepID=A0A0A2WM30_9GAMM|nr:DUF4239 domain-containing protein [Lysobacter dokdonensis]KGQ19340.1 putative integral membrane protein [Lysobacter dokdonensis DS-58]